MIVVLDAGHHVVDARADDVFGKEERDGQAERDLRGFPRRHHEGAAQIEGAQHQRDMDEHRAVEKRGAERIAPDRQEDVAGGFGGVERDQRQRQIAEMHDHEDHEDQARDEARGAVVALIRLAAGRGVARYAGGAVGWRRS